MDEKKYLNFPIRMLKGVLSLDSTQRKSFLDDIINIAVMQRSRNLEGKNEFEETESERVERVADYFLISLGSTDRTIYYGERLLKKYKAAKVYVGINKDDLFDFLKNDKDSFEWECLLAYLALKSIVGRSKYVRTNNKFLLARMSGAEKISEYENTLKFTRYHLDKIKTELQLNWFTVYYSRFTQGFYVGFDITLEDLVFEAESRKKIINIRFLENQKKEALIKALAKL